MAPLLAGNTSPSVQQVAYDRWLAWSLGPLDSGFGAPVKRATKFVALNIYGESKDGKDRRVVETVHELVVTEDALNASGNLHGGCTAFLIDICSSTTLGPHMTDATPFPAVSLNINTTYHAPAPLGTPLKIVCRTVAAGGRVLTARAEVWDTKNDRLVASGTHMKMYPTPPKAKL